MSQSEPDNPHALSLVQAIFGNVFSIVKASDAAPDRRMLAFEIARNIAEWDAGTGIVVTDGQRKLLNDPLRLES